MSRTSVVTGSASSATFVCSSASKKQSWMEVSPQGRGHSIS